MQLSHNEETLTDRTVGGFLWLLTGTGGQSILQLVVLVILARLLTPEEFGVVGAAMVVIAFSQIFTQLGVGQAIIQHPQLTKEHIYAGTYSSLIFGIFTGLVVYWASDIIAIFFKINELSQVIKVMSVIFPIKGVAIISNALLTKEMKFKIIALVELISYAVGFGIVGILLALYGYGLWSLVFGQLTQAAIRTVVLLFLKPKVFGRVISLKAYKDLINYGGGVTIGKIGSYTATQADNLIVGRFLGAEALGLYGRAYQFLNFVAKGIGQLVDQVLFPAMSSVQENKEKLCYAYRISVSLIAMITLPLSGLLILLAPEIVYILLGPQWSSVIIPFQILISVMVFRTSYKISDSLARAKGLVYRHAIRQWIYAFAIGVTAYTGHFWGIVGVSIGVAVAIFINFFLMVQLSITISGIRLNDIIIIHLRYVALTISILFPNILIVYYLRTIDISDFIIISISSIIGVCSFLLSLSKINIFIGSEKEWLVNIIKRRISLIYARFGLL